MLYVAISSETTTKLNCSLFTSPTVHSSLPAFWLSGLPVFWSSALPAFRLSRLPHRSWLQPPWCFDLNPSFCQGSSVVEQRTHKPLVGSSTLPPGTMNINDLDELKSFLWTCSANSREGSEIEENAVIRHRIRRLFRKSITLFSIGSGGKPNRQCRQNAEMSANEAP